MYNKIRYLSTDNLPPLSEERTNPISSRRPMITQYKVGTEQLLCRSSQINGCHGGEGNKKVPLIKQGIRRNLSRRIRKDGRNWGKIFRTGDSKFNCLCSSYSTKGKKRWHVMYISINSETTSFACFVLRTIPHFS